MTTYTIDCYTDSTQASGNNAYTVITSSGIPNGLYSGENPLFVEVGDIIQVNNTTGPSGQSGTVIVEVEKMGGRFGSYSNVSIAVGNSSSFTVANGMSGPVFFRIRGAQVTATQDVYSAHIPLFVRPPAEDTVNYGIEIYAPNGTGVMIGPHTNIISKQKDYTTTVNLAAGASTTISQDEIGNFANVEHDSVDSGIEDLEFEAVNENEIRVTNTNSSSSVSAELFFIRVF